MQMPIEKSKGPWKKGKKILQISKIKNTEKEIQKLSKLLNVLEKYLFNTKNYEKDLYKLLSNKIKEVKNKIKVKNEEYYKLYDEYDRKQMDN